MPEIYDVLIIGGGPAGLAAALYASRGRYQTLLLEKESQGGKLLHAGWIPDYPGLPDGMSGADLGRRMWEQGTRFGAEAVEAEATAITLEDGLKAVDTTAGMYRAKTVILATGLQAGRLGLPGAERFEGNGVYSCAVCNASRLTRGPVAVLGSGDEAFSDAVTLAGSTDRVTLISPDPEPSATHAWQREAEQNARITLLTGRVESLHGNGRLSGLLVRDLAGGVAREIPAEALFVDVNFHPATGLLADLLALGPDGAVPVDEWMRTSVSGIFAAGDIRSDASRLVIAAAGDGATAAIAAGHYLDTLAAGGH